MQGERLVKDAALVSMLFLVGCHPPVDEVFVPDLPTGGCGAPAYSWAPMETMGEIVSWERSDELSMAAPLIDFVLEEAGASAFTPVQFGVEVYLVRYLTQDRGQIVEASGFIALPDLDAAAEVPSVAWLHHTMGFNDSCAPTRRGIEGAAGAIVAASQGYAVAAPDYLGMKGLGEPSSMVHPYVVGEPTAVASLDMVRALWRFTRGEGPGGVDARAGHEVVFWGGSEGGFAALWADRYAPGYLPEAEVSGVVAAVPPTELLGIAQYGLTVYGPATEGLAAILGTAHPWYRGDAPFTDVFTDAAPASFASQLPTVLATECDDAGLFDLVDEVAAVYTEPFRTAMVGGDWDSAAPWSCYLEQSSLHQGPVAYTSDAPVLVTLGELDDLVYTPVVRASLPVLCDDGYEIETVECAGADHVEGASLSISYQLEWIRERLDGVPVPADKVCAIDAPVDCTALGTGER